MEVSFSHSSKALSPIEVTWFEIVTDINPMQQLKAPSSIEVTLFGIVIEVNPLQLLKAYLPILVILFGRNNQSQVS